MTNRKGQKLNPLFAVIFALVSTVFDLLIMVVAAIIILLMMPIMYMARKNAPPQVYADIMENFRKDVLAIIAKHEEKKVTGSPIAAWIVNSEIDISIAFIYIVYPIITGQKLQVED